MAARGRKPPAVEEGFQDQKDEGETAGGVRLAADDDQKRD